jgi:endonuclease G
MYIIAGPSGSGGVGTNGSKTSISGPASGGATMTVKVPAYTWKVVVVFPNGTSDTTRTPSRVIAVKVPNSDTATTLSTDWGGYRVSVSSIETLTGYSFFSSNSHVNKTTVDTGATK